MRLSVRLHKRAANIVMWALFAGIAYNTGRSSVRMRLALENGLSSRETDVLFLLLQGNSKQKVSEELCVSYNTVRSHVRNIYSKCDVHSQQDLINLFETYLHA